jgi:aspartate/tyrosine/aromatic aminotransferase
MDENEKKKEKMTEFMKQSAELYRTLYSAPVGFIISVTADIIMKTALENIHQNTDMIAQILYDIFKQIIKLNEGNFNSDNSLLAVSKSFQDLGKKLKKEDNDKAGYV